MMYISCACPSKSPGHASSWNIIADALFSLDEPWRTRFLAFVAYCATGEDWKDRVPQYAQVVAWLRQNTQLCAFIGEMLRLWCKI